MGDKGGDGDPAVENINNGDWEEMSGLVGLHAGGWKVNRIRWRPINSDNGSLRV